MTNKTQMARGNLTCSQIPYVEYNPRADSLVPSRLRVTKGVRGDRERLLGTSQIRGVFIDHKNCRLNSLERLEVNQLAIYKHGQRVELRT